MTETQTTIDQQELDKFAQHASQWWDINGPLKTLHDINQTRLDFITQFSSLHNAQVLDVGCGGGILSESMAKIGAKVTGVDATDEAIQVAKAHALKNKLQIDYKCSPIEHLEDCAFDVITCMELLEHVPNPELVIEHCKRLLKPNGRLFVSTINRTAKAYASAIIAAEYLLGLLPKQTHDYQKFLKPSELYAIARSFDLELIEIKGMAYNPLTRKSHLTDDTSVNYLMAFSSISG